MKNEKANDDTWEVDDKSEQGKGNGITMSEKKNYTYKAKAWKEWRGGWMKGWMKTDGIEVMSNYSDGSQTDSNTN